MKKTKSLIYLILLGMLFMTSNCGQPITTNPAIPVLVSWDTPIGDITDLAGYRIHLGKDSGRHERHYRVLGNTEAVIPIPYSGMWYVCVTAYDLSGNESFFPSEVSLNIP